MEAVTGGFVFAGENGRPEGLWGNKLRRNTTSCRTAWTPPVLMTVRASYSIVANADYRAGELPGT